MANFISFWIQSSKTNYGMKLQNLPTNTNKSISFHCFVGGQLVPFQVASRATKWAMVGHIFKGAHSTPYNKPFFLGTSINCLGNHSTTQNYGSKQSLKHMMNETYRSFYSFVKTSGVTNSFLTIRHD